MSKNYFIKEDYQSRKDYEISENVNLEYWNEERIKQSLYFQYDVYKFCKKLIIKKNLKTIMDIGCGPATKLMHFIYPICKEIYGIDRIAIIEYCKKKYNIDSFYADDIENSKLDLKIKLDLIISSDVIEHLINPNNLLLYIKKYAHKNTYIVLSTPERDIIRGKSCNSSPKKEHIREWNKLEFSRYLEYNGFQILSHKIIIAYHKLHGFKDIVLNLLKKDKNKSCQLVLCKLKEEMF